jgi:hypothetical protein
VRYPDIDPNAVRWKRRSYRDLLTELQSYRRDDRALVVGIDGHSGSGKTTLTTGLAALDRRIAVVHTDDLAWHHSFFGWGDLLIEHILVPFRRGDAPISYRPPGWIARDQTGSVTIPDDATTLLVEGVGACRREARPYLDAMVWVHARAEVGRRRVIAKGTDSEQFINDWMAEENAFLADHRPWECADVIVAGELGQPSPHGTYGNVVTAASR